MELQKGFTLIELMIAVTIIAILASVALPSYNEYVVRSKVPDATTALSVARVRMEQCFQDSRTYVGCSCTGTSKYFDVSCAGLSTAITYTLQAVGQDPGPMAGFTYTVDQANTQTTDIASPAPEGWRTTDAISCWVTKKGGQC